MTVLKLLLGRARSGKSAELLARVKQQVAAGRQVIYLVPEQASYQTESALFSSLTRAEFSRVSVCSFTRLCAQIFAKNGGLALPDLTDVGGAALMSVSFDEVKDQLHYYDSQSMGEGFLSALLSARQELYNLGLTPKLMEETAQLVSAPALQQKLGDLAAVYTAFDSLIDSAYADETEKLYRAVERRGDFFAGKAVFVEEFTGFTKPQTDLLTAILRDCDSLTVALTCDELYPRRAAGKDALSPFWPAVQTGRRLLAVARKWGVPAEKPKVMRADGFVGDGPRQMERALAGHRPAAVRDGTLTVMSAATVFEECEAVAAKIAQLVRQGYRYRDIAVMARSAQDYAVPIRQAFAARDIPYFLDENQQVYAKPTVTLCLHLLSCAVRGLTPEDICAIAREGVLGATEETICDFEDYLYTWDLRGSALKEPFTRSPGGFGGQMTAAEKQQLARIEALRAQVVGAVQTFAGACRRATGGDIVKALFAAFGALGTGELGQQKIEQLEELGETQLADDFVAQWDAVMGVLDELYLTLRRTPMSVERFLEVLRLSLQKCDFGTLPRSLDEVLVGSADKTRPAGIRVCFVVGAVFGSFPLQEKDTGLLSQKEKNALVAAGVDFLPDTEQDISIELGHCYSAATAPAEVLYISYYTGSLAGEESRPSELVETARRIPGAGAATARQVLQEAPHSPHTAFMALCQSTDQPAVQAALQQALGPGYTGRIDRVLGAPQQFSFHLDPAESRLLFGSRLGLSPTGLEQFENCRFSFFLRRGLHIAPPPKGEISPLETGSFIHYLLEQVLSRFGRGFPAAGTDEIAACARQVADEYVAQSLGRENLTARQQYLLQKIQKNTLLLLGHLQKELAQSLFFPQGFEVPIGAGSDIPPLRVSAGDGTVVEVSGTVDRVDSCQLDDREYLRVIDYKSGGKAFALEDVYSGLNMQMLIYLFALCEHSGQQPAGVLYMPASVDYTSLEREPSPKDDQLFGSTLQQKGLVLSDPAVITAMEREVAGRYIPVTAKKDGSFSQYSRTASAEEFSLIRGHIEHTLRQLADTLHRGDIAALPLRHGQFLLCDYCDYRRVCMREDDDPARSCPKIKTDKLFFERLREEETDGR